MNRFFLSQSNRTKGQASAQSEACSSPSTNAGGEVDFSVFHWINQSSDKSDFIWLVYSLFLFVEPIQEKTLHAWLALAIVYPIFLLLYCGWVFARNARGQRIALALMVLLGFAYLPINQGASTFFIYVAGFLPFMLVPAWQCFLIVIAIYAGYAYEVERLHLSSASMLITLIISLALCAGSLVIAQRKRFTRKLFRTEQERAQMAKLAERERIARDLHDLLGHTLTVIALKAELAHRSFDHDQERARREIAEVEVISREALTQVRQAVTGYRMEGWSAELARARSAFDAAGIRLVCEEAGLRQSPMQSPALSPIEETMLALILREATTNILRHAQASEVEVNLRREAEGTWLKISDNGCGHMREEGNGIQGMRERVAVLGGSIKIESGAGTRIMIELPGEKKSETLR